MDRINASLQLIQKKQGLTFGTDAYLLAAFIRPNPRQRAVDLGSGTGVIPLLLCANRKVADCAAVELQPAFAELIGGNASINQMEDQIRVICTDVRELNASAVGGEVDLVCSNPPYLTDDCGRMNQAPEKEIARHEVHGGIRDFCAAASRLLKTKGRFACVYRAERLVDLLSAMRDNRLEPKRLVFVHADPQSPPCMVLAEAMKDAAPSLKVEPPLFLYKQQRKAGAARIRTSATAAIYRTCSFPQAGKAQYRKKVTKENQP